MSCKSRDRRRFHKFQSSRFLLSVFKAICLEKKIKLCFPFSFSLPLPLYDVERRPEKTEPLNHVALLSFHLILFGLLILCLY